LNKNNKFKTVARRITEQNIMETIEIRNLKGEILFSHSRESNTTRATLEKAASIGANLSGADLSGADLRDANLSSAILREADLRDANLSGANLSSAILRDADLRDANLSGANLSSANLSSAILRDADLSDANLSGANLSSANLSSAILRDADLSSANLSSAILRKADLSGADNIPFIPLACPSEGEFIGWKKVGDYVIKLRIPAYAKRCSATTSKCRCDKAEVISIIGTGIRDNESIDSIVNDRYNDCEYTVGKMVYPDTFDDNRWNECSHGIHFFINKQEAINYI
jgi:hypothetical protein